MKRQVLYSGSKRTPNDGSAAPRPPEADVAPPPASRVSAWSRLRSLGARKAMLAFLGGAAAALLIGSLYRGSQPQPPVLTQEDIDAAVMNTLENKTLPARAAKAAEMV